MPSKREDNGEVERVFKEMVSGKNTDLAALQQMIALVREGDEVVVFSIDRLARDLRDLQTIVQTLNDKGVTITFLSERLTFTDDIDDALSCLQLRLMGAAGDCGQAQAVEKTRSPVTAAPKLLLLPTSLPKKAWSHFYFNKSDTKGDMRATVSAVHTSLKGGHILT